MEDWERVYKIAKMVLDFGGSSSNHYINGSEIKFINKDLSIIGNSETKAISLRLHPNSHPQNINRLSLLIDDDGACRQYHDDGIKICYPMLFEIASNIAKSNNN